MPASDWLIRVRWAITSKSCTAFMFHGNVRDYPPGLDGYTLIHGLKDVFQKEANSWRIPLEIKPIVISQNGGMRFDNPKHIEDFNTAMAVAYQERLKASGQFNVPSIENILSEELVPVISDPETMPLSRSLYTINSLLLSGVSGVLVFLDYAQLVFGTHATGFHPDGTMVEAVQRWAFDLDFKCTNVVKDGERRLMFNNNWVCLVADSVEDIHPEIKNFQNIMKVEVPLPNLAQRESKLTQTLEEAALYKLEQVADTPALARASAGLRLVDIDGIIWDAVGAKTPLDLNYINEAKRAVIEDQFSSVLSTITPRQGFESIGGHQIVKDYFLQLRTLVDMKMFEYLPTGLLLSGPAGTGKTVIVKAAAQELGFQMVQLDPSKTYNSLLGETEKNLRRAFDCVLAMAPCIVFVDEVDQAYMRGAQGDSGVSQRIFKMMLEFMADPENHKRGILFVGATNQPKNVDPALVRPGRMGDIIPVLPPKTPEGRWQIVKAIGVQTGLTVGLDDETALEICGTDLDKLYTGAELKEVVLTPLREVAIHGGDPKLLTEDSLRAGFDRVKPSTRDVESWTDEAIKTASKLSYIPEEYRATAPVSQPVDMSAYSKTPLRNPLN